MIRVMQGKMSIRGKLSISHIKPNCTKKYESGGFVDTTKKLRLGLTHNTHMIVCKH